MASAPSPSPPRCDSKQGWARFPQDLVSVPVLSKEYIYLTNEGVLRELGQEIRANFLREAKASGAFDMDAGAVVLKGGTSLGANYYDTDTVTAPFRQESYFQYLFRLCEPDCYGVIFLRTGETYLFVPEIPKEAERWNGPAKSFEHYVSKYGVKKAMHVRSMATALADNKVSTVYTLSGTNTDSGMATALKPSFPFFKQDDKALHPVLSECRVIKTKREIDYLRACNLVSSQAHVFVMRHIKPGMSELQLESLFKAYCGVYGGARHMAYTCICASGPNGSILHYGHAGRPNDRISKKSDLLVLDMGGEFQGYATDITASYPISGKFSKEQANVHNAVREAQEAVFSRLKPGTSWKEMHRVAERTILKHLLQMGVLKSATVEELMKHDMAAVFMPHGLGHFIGMDVHDVNGYPEGSERDMALGVRWLRTQRVLKENMVLTVEPGLYFNNEWMDSCFEDKKKASFVDFEVLKKYRGIGGVRLEDDVVITKDGYENFTILPKTIEEYESVIGKYTPSCSVCE